MSEALSCSFCCEASWFGSLRLPGSAPHFCLLLCFGAAVTLRKSRGAGSEWLPRLFLFLLTLSLLGSEVWAPALVCHSCNAGWKFRPPGIGPMFGINASASCSCSSPGPLTDGALMDGSFQFPGPTVPPHGPEALLGPNTRAGEDGA